MNKGSWSIILFGLVTAGCGFAGHALNLAAGQTQDPMQSPGVLLWLVSPLAANLLLRWLGKEGWSDFGLRPNLLKGWKWYLAALLIAPAVSVLILGAGTVTGTLGLDSFQVQGFRAFLALTGSLFTGSMVKNIFEEFAWRGYLTPRLAALKVNPLISALVTGVIWASWHVPYYLFFLSPETMQQQTALSVPALIGLAFILLPVQALVYGELRLLSQSVWSTWLLHNLANALSFALVSGGFVAFSGALPGVVITPSTEGILYTLLLGLIGWGLYQYRRRA
jgi:membrane protease YdiL (CAAX protease family)